MEHGLTVSNTNISTDYSCVWWVRKEGKRGEKIERKRGERGEEKREGRGREGGEGSGRRRGKHRGEEKISQNEDAGPTPVS